MRTAKSRATTVAAATITAAAALAAGPAAAPAAADPPLKVRTPAAGSSAKVAGSLLVQWTNTTGKEVDVWLSARTPSGGHDRLSLVAPKAGSKRAGEALATLPVVPPGTSYTVEVTTQDGAESDVSGPLGLIG
ncbi:hypothetical protein CP973_25175 [Streptomyces albofaciens JCM 4342]|uniref:hypothetical protein n=1 Tax=Streptomyces albofaciens TaxID=66866 RepID=UPI001238729A|nr:hypothetical protein [Streptomyces albofaciens]KAA6212653.1 hypothetical protein CP973_25175 [Streptomyces albofaciens JCM 4342]